jgi:AcrR family transcriptional regulator
MRRVQQTALDLFEARGFERVTVEEIAARAEVGVATVYRQFATKEGIVLWDEYDPMLLEAIARRLPARHLRAALLEALVEALDGVYAQDAERILRRARIIMQHPAVARAATTGQAALMRGIVAVLLERRACRSELEAEVVAGAMVATLEVAARQWVRGDGKPALRRYLQRSFAFLERLAAP